MNDHTMETLPITTTDLENIRKNFQMKNELIGSEKKEKVLICMGGGCIASGSQKIKEKFESCLLKSGLDQQVSVVGTGCLGPCSKGPVVVLSNKKIFYQDVEPNDVEDIIEESICHNRTIDRLLYREDTDSNPITNIADIPFFKRQSKVVLRNCGQIDPLKIDEYIGMDGYFALSKVLHTMKPEDVINQLKISGLRGRGGAGFPTWMKWNMASKKIIDQKYILCNADEGDPGAYMDRSVLEGDPHSVIEGMAIGAFAIEATKGFVYVRAEYPLAVERLQAGIR